MDRLQCAATAPAVTVSDATQNLQWVGLTNLVYNVQAVTNLFGSWKTLGGWPTQGPILISPIGIPGRSSSTGWRFPNPTPEADFLLMLGIAAPIPFQRTRSIHPQRLQRERLLFLQKYLSSPKSQSQMPFETVSARDLNPHESGFHPATANKPPRHPLPVENAASSTCPFRASAFAQTYPHAARGTNIHHPACKVR